MAHLGRVEALLGGLPQDQRRIMIAVMREALAHLRFGAPPESLGVTAAEHFGGALVRFATSSTANAEVAIAHRLERTPRFLIPLLALDTVNATVPVLTVTRAADPTYVYVKSPSTSTECLAYVE